MPWEIRYANSALRDAKKVKEKRFQKKVESLIAILIEDPFEQPYEALVGNLAGAYSRRINHQHRLVYQVFEDKKIVRILRMWTHYK